MRGYIATMKIFRSYSEVSACVGQEVAVTDWITITQEQVNLFAQATGDHQWIHVDPERAKAGPFGAPIAHGFLTLSLIPQFFETGLTIEGARMGVNYGLNKVRFTAPVPVGSRLRARLTLQAIESANVVLLLLDATGAGLFVGDAKIDDALRADPFGPVPAGADIMRRIRDSFDPAGILCPGRFAAAEAVTA